MRLATLRLREGTRAARVDGDRALELPYRDVGALLRHPDWHERATQDVVAVHDLGEVALAPVVTEPSKIICLGLNYRYHIRETGRDLPEYPTLFAKFAAALIGARDAIVLPAVSDKVDWEVELAFVIGRRARHVSAADAPALIAGYTILNDISVRDYQYRTAQWLQGKTFEATTPVGPALVTPDEMDHARDLEVRCEVDGRVVQRARTGDLLFKPAEIVSYLSDIVTLEPGDLIATGTPAGVGAARTPPQFLRAGQVVRTSIEGLGDLTNPCRRETVSSAL